MNILFSILLIIILNNAFTEKDKGETSYQETQNQEQRKIIYADNPLFNGKDKFFNDWIMVDSKHFIFHFPSNSIVKNKDQFINNHEQAYAKLNSFLETSLPQKINYFVWNYSYEAEKFGIGVLSFALPELCLVHVHAAESIGHEMTHLLTYYLPGSTGIKTKFINEGIATYFDLNNRSVYGGPGFKKPNEKISLIKAWENDYTYSDYVYYFLGAEVIKLLNQKFGKDKLIRLIENQSYKNALNIYGKELTKVIEEVENKIN